MSGGSILPPKSNAHYPLPPLPPAPKSTFPYPPSAVASVAQTTAVPSPGLGGVIAGPGIMTRRRLFNPHKVLYIATAMASGFLGGFIAGRLPL